MSLFSKLFVKRKYRKAFTVTVALVMSTHIWAAGPPGENPLNNPLAVLLISLMIILLIAIAILASILTGVADFTLIKWKKENEPGKKSVATQAAALFIGLMMLSSAVIAQDKTNVVNLVQTAKTIGGLSPGAFYTMISIVFLELLVMLVLIMNIRILLKSQKEALTVTEPQKVIVKKPAIIWWNRFNKFKPIEQETDIDLGHDYDGIRELDNRLPPWWIYGFYLTIIVAGIYLWRYHIAHTAPLSKEEYEIAVQKADQKVKEFLKQKGEVIDENSVTMLDAVNITEGKRIFQASCISCHNEGGAGNVGPNLTDNYWIHGGDIKSVFKTIKYGFNAMPTWQTAYSNKQIAQLASYVKSLQGTNPPNAKAPQGELYKEETAVPGPTADSTAARKDNKVAVY